MKDGVFWIGLIVVFQVFMVIYFIATTTHTNNEVDDLKKTVSIWMERTWEDDWEFDQIIQNRVAKEIYEHPEMVKAMMALYDKRLSYWTLTAVRYPNEYYKASFLDSLNEIAMTNYVKKCEKEKQKYILAALKNN